ncbi:aldehyde dehydrogenase family protein [Glaciibacter sp. 2TAF33]|uniref:aldehyde dehydrogenase family protein n=1 Tax=Glaciibacter sp. 2TAF33 TaxID=3233015 RepID=UPI003F9138A3
MSRPERVPNLIGGKRLAGETWFDVIDPGRPNQVVGQAAEGGSEHVDRALQAATEVAPAWAATPVEDRVDALNRGLAHLSASAGELAGVLLAENGALLREAELDIQRSIELARDMARRAVEHLRPRFVEDAGGSITVLRKPIGPVGMVVPWNSPMVLAASKVAPALAAGNTVILKPSPEAPLALTRAMELLASELPPGTLNVVNSAGTAGPALSAHPGVRKMSFTGSTKVGREVMSAAATNVKRVSLELGGNDPAIVLEDADFAQSIPMLARGVYTRAGQICFGVKRIYVARSRFDEFVDALCTHVDDYVCGYGADPASTYGPMINAHQQARVNAMVEAARDAGAHVRTLGRISEQAQRDGGYYLRPSVVTGIPQSAPLVAEEQFGPAIPVLPFDDADHAVALANDSEYGLASSVWSADPEHAMSVATRLEAGCTFVNSHNIWSLSFDMPFGGVKQSGLGRERTEMGLDEYVETHAIRVSHPTT